MFKFICWNYGGGVGPMYGLSKYGAHYKVKYKPKTRDKGGTAQPDWEGMILNFILLRC